MALVTVGLAIFIVWPIYHLVLIVLSARDSRRGAQAATMEPPKIGGAAPERFWIIVPCLNEERVVGRTVSAALALTGPPGTVSRVLVVDDGSDDGTPAALAAIKHPNLVVMRRTLPNARRGKGEALNQAYRLILSQTKAERIDPRRVAVGVIDGDGRGSTNMLTEVARIMQDAKVGAVQCRVRIHNRDRILGAVQDLEFGSIVNASQLLRNSVGSVGLGGNGQFARLSALAALGTKPWSKCLVEDLELGLRLHLAGFVVRFASRAAVTQQGVVDVRRLVRQRTRWAQGNLQCAGYVPRLIGSRKITNGAMLEMLYYLLSPWMNALGAVFVAGLFGVAAYSLLPGHEPTPYAGSWLELALAIVLWAGATMAPGLVWAVAHRMQLRDERMSRLLLAGLVFPAFLFLGLLATVRAIGRQVSGRHGWAKTERLAEEPLPGPMRPATAP
jgi:cellulose synthase/poly-beta-1,6-N-acetylglucosamine synthase-like glycosyltransferase